MSDELKQWRFRKSGRESSWNKARKVDEAKVTGISDELWAMRLIVDRVERLTEAIEALTDAVKRG